jgi:two-component sensor histidine kinase
VSEEATVTPGGSEPGLVPARLTLPHTVTAVRTARRFVDGELSGWGVPVDPDARYTAELLTSEIVTNALRYGAPPLRVAVQRLGRSCLRVEVGDGTRRPPARLDPSPGHEGGRGILLLDQLATAWGYRPLGRGKVVWYELELARPPDPDGLHW